MSAHLEMPWTAPRPVTRFDSPSPSPVVLRLRIESDIAEETADAKKQAYFERLALACAGEKKPAPVAPWADEILHAEDEGFITTAQEGLRISDDDRAFAFSATGEYLALCKEQTGDSVSDETLKKFRESSKELLDQSHAIADKMLRAGFNPYRETPFGLYRYYIHSQHVEKLPGFRRCVFIPYVAKQVRGPMLSALEYWLERHPFARFWTFTSGMRVTLSGVRDRAQDLHRRLSELNAQPFMRRAGARLVFRSTELGTPETNARGHVVSNNGLIETDEDGQFYFHVHAHCVVELTKGPLHGKKWERLLQDVHGFWKHNWDDGGSVRGADECCKYVTKPGEMLKLSGADLVALQAQLSRLKLCQPMGSLAEEIKARKNPDCPLRLVRKRTPDGPVFREVKNWNRHNTRTRTEKHMDAAARLEMRGNSEACRVVARSVPAIGPCGVSEPRVTVMTTRWDAAAVQRNPFVTRLVEHTANEFWAGHAIRVHTCTSTVGETGLLPFAKHLPPARGRLTEAEIAGFSR